MLFRSQHLDGVRAELQPGARFMKVVAAFEKANTPSRPGRRQSRRQAADAAAGNQQRRDGGLDQAAFSLPR